MSYKLLLSGLVSVSILTLIPLLSIDLPFFWDGVLISKTALFYKNSHFQTIILPDILDAGHPPLFSLYIALLWKIFGLSLRVAHLAMLPFLWLFSYSIFRLIQLFIYNPNYQIIAFILILINPVLLAQSTMVMYEIPMLALFFYAFVLLLRNQNLWLLIFISIALALLNLRGVALVCALFFTQLLLNKNSYNKFKFIDTILLYIPSAFVFIAWIVYHYSQTGWFISSISYGGGRELVNTFYFFKNIVIVAHRLLDYGQFSIWIGLIVILIFNWKQFIFTNFNKKLFYFLFFPTILLSVLSLPINNPIGHRYFLISQITAVLIFIKVISEFNLKKSVQKLVFVLTFFCLASGSFWIYPNSIAQGWDSTLAHVPFFDLQKEMTHYINENQINYEDIFVEFPYSSDEFTQLKSNIQNYNYTDFKNAKYIITSNIINFNPSNSYLNSKFTLIKKMEKRGVYIEFWKQK